jgi:hypothetical protein
MTHEEHQAQMRKEAETKRRGAEGMGFDQDKTTHHFRLTTEGGLISVAANSAEDTASRDQIRMHLKVIAEQFQRGDFGKPAAQFMRFSSIKSASTQPEARLPHRGAP